MTIIFLSLHYNTIQNTLQNSTIQNTLQNLTTQDNTLQTRTKPKVFIIYLMTMNPHKTKPQINTLHIRTQQRTLNFIDILRTDIIEFNSK